MYRHVMKCVWEQEANINPPAALSCPQAWDRQDGSKCARRCLRHCRFCSLAAAGPYRERGSGIGSRVSRKREYKRIYVDAPYLYYTVREPFRAAPPQPVSYLDRFMPSSRCTLFHRCRRMGLFSVTVWSRIFWSSTLVCMPRSAWPRRKGVS